MFEVQDLKYATLATVSRCGMVWFSEDVLSTDMIFNNFLARIRSIPLDEGEDEAHRKRTGTEDEEEAASPMLQVVSLQKEDAETLVDHYTFNLLCFVLKTRSREMLQESCSRTSPRQAS